MGNRKQGICMADGGITQESPELLMARMAARYGTTGGAQSAPAPTPVAQPQPQQPQPQQQPQQQKSSGLGIMSLLKGRTAQIDKAVNGYADGGIAGHVKFEGKGGPRDDQIPVKVAGQEINVSNKEQALIIPAKTAANAQAMAAIKQIIADSNDGRQPDMGHGDSNFAEGGLLDDEARKMNYQAVTGVQAPAPTPQPAAQPDSGGWSLGKSGPGANLQVTTGDAARLPAPAVQQGIATMRNQLATPQPAAASGSNYVGNGPTDPDTNGRQAIAAPSNAVQRGIETMRGQINQNPAASENAIATAAANEHVKSLYPAGTFDKAASSPAAAPSITGVSNVTAAVPQQTASPGADIIAKHQAILNGQQSVADQGALDALKTRTPNPMQQDMPLTTKDIVPGGYIDRGAGIVASRNKDGRLAVSNVGTQGIADMSNGVMDDSASAAARHAADVKSGNTVQQVYDRMLRNRLTADMNDPTITDPSVRANAAKGLAAMGNPEDQQLKQAQTQGIMATTESAQMLAGIQKKALAGDPQAMASYKALTQKGGADY
ncbi:MAG TPA: hypothetical protein PLI90_08305, partial [Rhodocyclaceae bacterium]|nr:hypothetical protein [Rhodocyclaceae bacterium]